MENQIKRVNRTLKYQGVIVDFYSDTMQMPDGRMAEWDLIPHRKGAAAVVPVPPKKSNTKSPSDVCALIIRSINFSDF